MRMIDYRTVWFLRGLKLAVLAAGAVCAASPQQPPSLSEPPPRALLDRYCVGCHSDRVKAGGLVLNSLGTQNISQHTDVWEKVVRKLRARSMPPAGLPRPDESTYQTVVA